MTTDTQLDLVIAESMRAAAQVAASTAAERSRWLVAIADALDTDAHELVALAVEETHLAPARLTGEVARTSGQLRSFAASIIEGSYLEAIIDHAQPDATPPRPDLRRMLLPIGPVAVFSASNFPFAFSVVGGDTASALAAGCPVVVKAHSGHIGLSRLTARLARQALESAGAPDGILALVEGREAGEALVTHPSIRAVGFTGSLSGGRALFDLAAGRADPIPFYGELGSLNPVVITGDAIRTRGVELAEGLVASFTLGSGQFCTKPGVVLVPADEDFSGLIASAMGEPGESRLLTDRIGSAFAADVASLSEQDDVSLVAGRVDQSASAAYPVVFSTTTDAVLADPDALLSETFGPTTLLVRYSSPPDALRLLHAMPGSLTATIHAEPDEDIADLVEIMTARAGRILFAGWPTGVAVTWSQQHGGPWPATTSLHTSVGMTATRRFLRPVVFQDAPPERLPSALREGNPLGIPRRIDGVLRIAAV